MADDQDWFITHGLVQQRTNIEDMVELSMVEQAIRELGSAAP